MNPGLQPQRGHQRDQPDPRAMQQYPTQIPYYNNMMPIPYGVHPVPYPMIQPCYYVPHEQMIAGPPGVSSRPYSTGCIYGKPMPSMEAQSASQNKASNMRERKLLEIVDPETKASITKEIEETPKSNNVTPNTTIENDAEARIAAFKKDFKDNLKPQEEEDKKESKEEEERTALPEPVAETSAIVEETLIKASEELDINEEATEEIDEPPSIATQQKESFQQADSICDSLCDIPDDKDACCASVSVDAFEAEEADSTSPDPEEEQKNREEEEAENLRRKKKEAIADLARYEKDLSQCNIAKRIYGKKFMNSVRTVEKLFNATEPPISVEELKTTYNIDINSMPKPSEQKQKKVDTSSNQKNMKGTGSKHLGRSLDGARGGPRTGGGGSGKKGLMFMNRPTIDRSPKVHLGNKAETAWKAEKLSKEEQEKEENKIKVLLKSVRSLFNKITPTTKDDLINEFLQLKVSGERPKFKAPDGQLEQVINIIFDKAVEEPRFCSLYSEICKRQVDEELRYSEIGKQQSPFRNAILTRSQNTFITKEYEVDKSALEEETDENKKREMTIKAEEEYNKFRRRKFGNINFIGQLYRQTILSTKIIQWCLYDLLKHTHPDNEGNVPEPPYDEESLLCATQLLEVIGKTLEKCKDLPNVGDYIHQVFHHLINLAPQCTPKIKFKIIGLKEFRENNWNPRGVVEQGPKKIEEIHQEEKQKQIEREALDRKTSRPIVNATQILRSSQTTIIQRRDNAGHASKQATPSAQHPRNTSLNSSIPKKSCWQMGSKGGGIADKDSTGPGSKTIIPRGAKEHKRDEDNKKSATGSGSSTSTPSGKAAPATEPKTGKKEKSKEITDDEGFTMVRSR